MLFLENMMECMTAILLKRVRMIESGWVGRVILKWPLGSISWFLSLEAW